MKLKVPFLHFRGENQVWPDQSGLIITTKESQRGPGRREVVDIAVLVRIPWFGRRQFSPNPRYGPIYYKPAEFTDRPIYWAAFIWARAPRPRDWKGEIKLGSAEIRYGVMAASEGS